MPRRLIDILNLAVALILVALATLCAVVGRLPNRPMVAGRFGILAGSVLILGWLARRPRLPWALVIVVNFYPLLAIPIVFDGLQPLISAVGLPNWDDRLIRMDRAIFGTDLTLAMEPLVRPWLNDLLHLAYCSYYLFPLVIGIAAWRRSREVGQRFIFVVTLAFYLSYVGYFLFPARGPRFAQAALYTTDTRSTPISSAIYHTLNTLEKTKDDVFPSGHVMITVICLMVAWTISRRLFLVLLPIGVLLCIATVYCRFHYGIDVVAGLALAFITVPLGNWLFRRYVSNRHEETPGRSS